MPSKSSIDAIEKAYIKLTNNNSIGGEEPIRDFARKVDRRINSLRGSAVVPLFAISTIMWELSEIQSERPIPTIYTQKIYDILNQPILTVIEDAKNGNPKKILQSLEVLIRAHRKAVKIVPEQFL